VSIYRLRGHLIGRVRLYKAREDLHLRSFLIRVKQVAAQPNIQHGYFSPSSCHGWADKPGYDVYGADWGRQQLGESRPATQAVFIHASNAAAADILGLIHYVDLGYSAWTTPTARLKTSHDHTWRPA
jgi:hypothetical protein